MRPRTAAAVVCVVLAGLAGCSSDSSSNDPATTSPAVTTPATTSSAQTTTSSTRPPTSARPSSTAPRSAASAVLAKMNLEQVVGQLIMIDCPSEGVSSATRAAIRDYDVGSVILDGTTTSGSSAVSAVTRELRSLAPSNAGLFIATDQEGGLVQRLQGQGFDRIPSGNVQGTRSASTLRSDAQGWGRQLRDAGVNMNLAPVLDVVPAGGGSNPPIGDLDRQYGSTPARVTSRGLAFAAGMTAAGVDPVVKHFPGLGRVSGNTDVAAGVTDTVTTSDDSHLAPFRAAVKADVPFVMMSTAIYSKIDPGTPAAFSKRIVTDLLRGDLGFDGVVVSDDIGAADQVGQFSPGQRAVKFVRAGGDLVLSVVADQAQPMTRALADEARSSSSFRTLVYAAALRVLQAKQARGLLG